MTSGALASDHELASAPIDAGAASAEPAAPARDCYCAAVTVRCSGASNAHARADRAGCVLELPAQSCALLDLVPGSKVDPLDILAAPVPTDVKGNDVWEVCTAKHEARHTCDGAAISACASELTAYDVSLDCMNAYAATDDVVAFNVENVVAAREMNACLCGGQACAACSAGCLADHPTRAATCDQAASVYCP